MHQSIPDNGLLRSLSRRDQQALQRHLAPVKIPTGGVLCEMETPAEWVYFPVSGLLSLISIMRSGSAIETSIVGREGSVGFVEALGSGVMRTRVIVQVPGDAYRVSARTFLQIFNDSDSLRTAVHKQMELLQAENRQAIACHGLHNAKQRFNRWMLECSDQAGHPPTMPLKQEFLAVMLGVSRPAVTRIALARQDEGLIRYSRGVVTLLDLAGLEAGACECRRSVQEVREELRAA